MTRKLQPEDLRIFIFHSQAVIGLVRIPVFQLDHKSDLLLFFYMLDTIKCLDIDDPDAAQLDEMSGDLRRCAKQRFFINLADLYDVICYQTMTAAHQLQCGFTLTDAALAHDQDTFSININQNAMHGNRRCQLVGKVTDRF